MHFHTPHPRSTRPERPQRFKCAAVLGSILLSSTFCVQNVSAQSNDGSRSQLADVDDRDKSLSATVDDYIKMDRMALSQAAANNPAAAALLATLDRTQDAPELLVDAIANEPESDARERMVTILLDRLIADHRWTEVVAIARQFVPDSGTINSALAYSKWPQSSIDYNGRDIVEVPFTGLYIPAKLNGQPIKIAFDTGAPGVGVHHDLIALVKTDRTAPQTAFLPAFDLTVGRYAALIDELNIGDVTLKNVAASVGRELTEEEVPKFAAMERSTGRHDIIMGLDALRPYFDVIEFDYDRDVVRLIRRDEELPATANMIMGGGRKPIVRLATQNRVSNVYVDTGSYGHLLGKGAFDTPACLPQRVMKAPWREITEHRVKIAFENTQPFEAWAQPGSAVTEPKWDLTGYIGNPRAGIYRLDVADGNFSLRNYDSTNLDSLWDLISVTEGSCDPAAVTNER